MTIEEKIKQLGIKRILIADDTKENLDAAKEYFDNKVAKYGVSFTYVLSEESAKKEIKEAFDSGEKFDLVVWDFI